MKKHFSTLLRKFKAGQTGNARQESTNRSNLLRNLCAGLLLLLSSFAAQAQSDTPLRRPVSTSQPMWLIHIDTWNYADPQKIIDMIPADIRPYVVMNISLSINHDETTGAWKTVEYGYETAKSWLRTCAENRIWATVQPASGGFCQFSDFDLTVFDEFYRDYPNFIGFNYAEQFWGFDDKFSVTYPQRLAHWVNLMKLNQKYGGYLIVSFCGSFYGASLNPIAMMKRDANFEAICRQDPEHFILCEKFTSAYGFSDIESTCEGSWLSGLSGQYGIRFDQCGWVGTTSNETFPVAAGAAPVLEHLMLTGETVIDGPELIWQQCFRELNPASTSDGFSMRKWDYFPQFRNISLDIFRKVLDGTVRILNRKEVIDRTKVVIVNDISSGTDQAKYSSPETLFEGLYRMEGDGNYLSNTSWFKKTGRYPSIPTVYKLADSLANTFQVKINKSALASRWSMISTKVNEFNQLFAQEYTGDLYAARHENAWITYNPFKTGQTAKASIPFQYNSCEKIELTYARYTTGIIREEADKLNIYLTNYDPAVSALITDTLVIYGSSNEPTYSFKDRGMHVASQVVKNWSNGICTLIVKHNGPLDLTVNCAGTATGRKSSITKAVLKAPVLPAVYTGPRQYEAENFDYKNIARNYTSGVGSGITNYTAQGFLKFGNNTLASIRDTIYALKTGIYRLKIRYTASGGSPSLQLRVNGVKKTVTFSKTASDSDWAYNIQNVSLTAGTNTIQLSSLGSSVGLFFDHVVVERNDNDSYTFTNDQAGTAATTPGAEGITVLSGTAGVVDFTDNLNRTDHALKCYSAGNLHATGVASADNFPTASTNYSVLWKDMYVTSGGRKGILMRAGGTCPYADGLSCGYLFTMENNADQTVTLKCYIAGNQGLTEKTQYTSSFLVAPGQPVWLRSSAYGNQLHFECSKDSANWYGANETVFTDKNYTTGGTQIVWGLESDVLNWVLDNLSVQTPNLSCNKMNLDGFSYVAGQGPSVAQMIKLTARALSNSLNVQAPTGYEVSTDLNGAYASSVIINPVQGSLSDQPVYIRLIRGMTTGVCYGTLSVKTSYCDSIAVRLSGNVSSKISYTFDTDPVSGTAQTPPANQVVIGNGNNATAGVAATPVSNNKAFRAFSGGERNGTGVATLTRFPSAATEYSVTWKYTFGSSDTEYKVGMLLRGSSPAGTSNGYVSGLMQGYLFLLYHNTNKTTTEFRIYKPLNSNTSIDRLATGTIAICPAVNTPVWLRAGVTGSSPVGLKFEYSTDSLTWNTAVVSSDATSPFTAGATQLVWGLAAGGMDFYIDNVTFNGSVGIPAPVKPVTREDAQVISAAYYTIEGRRLADHTELPRGFVIIRRIFSDGTVHTEKIFNR